MTDSGEKLYPHKGAKMPGVLEARFHLCAFPREHGDSKSSYLRRAAAFFGLSYWQAKKIYYGEAKRIDADRLDAMRARMVALHERTATRRETLDGLRNRIEELRAAGS